MPVQLYVFKTTFPNGTCTIGRAGLPYYEMIKLGQFHGISADHIAKGGQGTERILVHTPISIEISREKNFDLKIGRFRRLTLQKVPYKSGTSM